mgnify:CR=1 FL=1
MVSPEFPREVNAEIIERGRTLNEGRNGYTRAQMRKTPEDEEIPNGKKRCQEKENLSFSSTPPKYG